MFFIDLFFLQEEKEEAKQATITHDDITVTSGAVIIGDTGGVQGNLCPAKVTSGVVIMGGDTKEDTGNVAGNLERAMDDLDELIADLEFSIGFDDIVKKLHSLPRERRAQAASIIGDIIGVYTQSSQ